MSSTSIESTRRRAEDVAAHAPGRVHVFATGTPVPGLSSWLLERKLGGGGFGEVWLAKHAWDAEQRPRAVKFCTDPAARHRLVTHEKNVVLRVMKYAGKHPNIIPLLDCSLDGDAPWLMYEFVEGGTLAGVVAQWRKWAPRKRIDHAVLTLHAIAAALGTFHRFDPPLVHRDMKPHNVLMAGSVPRITDFGIGGVALRPLTTVFGGSGTEGSAQLPTELRAAGTRVYAPQEQLLGNAPHPRDDVYAMGIIAYQLLTADLMTAPGTDADHELRALGVPDVLIALILRSASINPDRRPADAGVWADTLAALIREARGELEPVEPAAPEPDLPAPVTEFHTHTEPAPVPSARSARPAFSAPAPSAPPPPQEPTTVRPPAADWRVWDEPKPAPKKKQTDAWVLVASLLIVAALSVTFFLLAPPGSGSRRARPGETREFPLPGGAVMTFCWVPAGECQLGSPTSERDAVMKRLGEKPAWLADEADGWRGKFTTKGFWMGKYEVTQAEWAAVMNGTASAVPSAFRAEGASRLKVPANAETGRFPVDSVSWVQCQEFLEKLNAQKNREKVFGGRGRFALPHENAWEYACRGGTGNQQPFSFGTELNGNQANVDGTNPFGTDAKGRHLERPTTVGSFADKAHPWGLCDMHGNVWEWCDNLYESTQMRVARGGSWFDPAHDARSANRNWYAPETRHPNVGVRVCWIAAE